MPPDSAGGGIPAEPSGSDRSRLSASAQDQIDWLPLSDIRDPAMGSLVWFHDGSKQRAMFGDEYAEQTRRFLRLE